MEQGNVSGAYNRANRIMNAIDALLGIAEATNPEDTGVIAEGQVDLDSRIEAAVQRIAQQHVTQAMAQMRAETGQVRENVNDLRMRLNNLSATISTLPRTADSPDITRTAKHNEPEE